MSIERKGLKRIHPVLNTFIDKIKAIYGDALKSVILFGSYARGDERDGSDVDILLLLDMDRKTIDSKDDALCELVFEYEVQEHIEISPVTMSVLEYTKWKNVHEFLKNVREDGVNLYGNAA